MSMGGLDTWETIKSVVYTSIFIAILLLLLFAGGAVAQMGWTAAKTTGGLGQNCNRDGTCDYADMVCARKPFGGICEPHGNQQDVIALDQPIEITAARP